MICLTFSSLTVTRMKARDLFPVKLRGGGILPLLKPQDSTSQASRGWPASSDAIFPTSAPSLPEVTLHCLLYCQSSKEHW